MTLKEFVDVYSGHHSAIFDIWDKGDHVGIVYCSAGYTAISRELKDYADDPISYWGMQVTERSSDKAAAIQVMVQLEGYTE